MTVSVTGGEMSPYPPDRVLRAVPVPRFPDYTFLGDPSVSKTAAVSSRYTDASLRGVITDIHALSLTDHLVCTFSSQVGGTALCGPHMTCTPIR